MSKSDLKEVNNQTKHYNDIPKHVSSQVVESLKEVELIKKGLLQSRTARQLLEELREEENKS